jgi:hypothetical protein
MGLVRCRSQAAIYAENARIFDLFLARRPVSVPDRGAPGADERAQQLTKN